MLILFPVCFDNWEFIENLIKINLIVIDEKQKELDEKEKFRLIYTLYQGESWIGNANNDWEGIKYKMNSCFNSKINFVKLFYVFSTENFNRSSEEVNYLMELFMKWFKKAKSKYDSENIKVLFSSQKEFLKPEIVKAIDELEEATKDNTGLVVNFCLSYGGRQEIVDATKKIATAVLENKLNINDINEELFKKYLYNDLPDVDFLIRTSGENRVSNFMLWQISYAEMYFPKVYFPDFTPKCLEEAIEEYEKRDRRFGNVK